MSKAAARKAFAKDFLEFVNESPTHFHAVSQIRQLLLQNEYKSVSERKGLTGVQPGGRYVFTRNQSALVAVSVGKNYKPGNPFVIMAAHTDSPVPKIKPVSKITKNGYQQVGVELYGGGLWNTWFDRDLSVAGRAVVANEDGSAFESKLLRIRDPILRIPNLAIHLNRDIYTKGFQINKETHVVPVLATEIKQALNSQTDSKQEEGKQQEEHHRGLLDAMASELQCSPEQIRDFEMCLYDTQPAQLGGLNQEFIFSRALDNLLMSFVCTRALLESNESLNESSDCRVVVLFDNEEIGSTSEHGAGSVYFQSVLQRLNAALSGDSVTDMEASLRKSVLVSADMAHAVHPNYAAKHEANHQPKMHGGLVIKQNCNQRYATTAITSFFITELAKRHEIPVQKFVVRNDSACGSTVGPMLSANLGVRTVDVGIPQLAMHSVREMCAVDDAHLSFELFTHFFNEYASLEESIAVEHESS